MLWSARDSKCISVSELAGDSNEACGTTVQTMQ